MGKPKFDANGLITAVLQDGDSGSVLMVAWMNAEALRLTQTTGEGDLWSRSRRELWRKGATSGNVMCVRRKFAWIAMGTRCCSKWTRPGQLATPASSPASSRNWTLENAV